MDRQPPFDLQAEIGVLGSAFLLPDVLDEVILLVRPDDFYDDAHRKLFVHMCAMHEANKKIDPTLLIDRLKTANEYEAIGGAAYLSKLINAVPNAAHATYYAEIVQQKSIYRSLILAATEILRNAYDATGDSDHTLAQAEQSIFSILDKRDESSCRAVRDVLMEALERIDAKASGRHDVGGVDTGFGRLDALTGGFHNSELLILAARPGMGKTALALNIAEHVSIDQNIPVLFVSLEMSAIELVDRLLCSIAKVNGHRVRKGDLSTEVRQKLVDTSIRISDGPLYIDDTPSRTVTQIAAQARRVRRRTGKLGLIVIDYLQLIEPDNQKDPRQEQVAKIARRLKLLARELEVPVLCLAQLNRQAESGTDSVPKLSHLRESGAIEQDADVVMFVDREEIHLRGEEREEAAGQSSGKAAVYVEKQRNGPTGKVELIFRKNFTRFENAAEPERHAAFDQYNDGFN
jgi:replicative DNA helicase